MVDLIKVRVNGTDVIELDLSQMIGEIVAAAVSVTREKCAKAQGYQSFRDSTWSLDTEAISAEILKVWEQSRSSG